MTPIKNPKFNGAQLIAELVKTGTGDKHLKPARAILVYIHRTQKRIADANDVIDALESAGVTDTMLMYPRTPILTIRKARALAEDGKWDGIATVPQLPVEEQILAGMTLPEEEPKSNLEKMHEEFNPAECEELAPVKLQAPRRPPAKKVKSDRPDFAGTAAS